MTRKTFSPRLAPRLLAAALACCFAGSAAALPTGAQVVAGTATLTQSGNTLNITNSNGAIINWQRFSIGAQEATRFIQPNTSSSVLNRVVGGDPTAIHGTLSSNGRVWLTNPAGILIGPGAHIDTAGLVASTLNIRNEDFLAGRLGFQATPGAGDVTIQGRITTPAGGSVYVVGANVGNEGIITTPQGETILAAGQTVNLVDTATPGVKVEITGSAGNATNLGRIVAEAGRIGIAGALVRNSGELNASSVVADGGRIFLKASGDTYAEGGAIRATGARGGRIEVLGSRVAVTGEASLDASGAEAGGSILVGGDYQGGNPDVQNAQITYFGPEASLKADATARGDGGRVIVWADDTTRAYGGISAHGGAQGGNGGFVETSGRKYLDATRAPDVSAPAGRGGEWLLDPETITISSAAGSNISGSSPFSPAVAGTASILQDSVLQSAIASGGTVTVDTTSTLAGTTGNIIVDSSATALNSLNAGASATLNLWADNDIAINTSISNTGLPLAMNFVANKYGNASTGTIAVANNVQIVPNNANVTLSAKGGITVGTNALITTGNTAGQANGWADLTLTASAGDVSIGASSVLRASQNINITATNIGNSGTIAHRQDYVGGPSGAATLTATGAITASGTFSSSDVNAGNTYAVTLDAAGNASVDGPMATGNGNVTITGNAITFTAAGDITAGTGTVNIASEGAGAQTSIPANTVISGGNIAIKTDQLSLGGTLSATSIASVTRYTDNSASPVELQLGAGASDSAVARTLGIDTAELANITADTYRFGDTTSAGGLRVAGAVSMAGKTLSLLTSTVVSSQIVQNGLATITADKLRAQGTAVTLTESNTVGTLAGKTGGQNFQFKNSTALAIGTVDGQAGIDAGANNIYLDAAGLSQSTGAILTADGLKIVSNGGVVLSQANLVNKLAATMTGASLSYSNAQDLAIDTVGAVNGISSTGNVSVSVTTTSGDLTVTQPVALTLGGSGGGYVSLTAADGISLNNTVQTTFNATRDGKVKLAAGTSGIQQAAAGVITASDLVVTSSLGDVALATATNDVADIAASIGNAGNQNKNFSLKSSAALNVTTIDGVAGISIDRDANNFASASPNGVIALTSSGALTQSAGATLSGKAVYAEGKGVSLTESNPIGVIAGKATGGASGDSFSYTSSAGISVTTVNGYSGILVNSGMPDTTSATLTASASGITQDSTAPISAPTGLVLSTSGSVNLSASNSVGALKALNVSSLDFNNSGALTIGVGADGITTTSDGDITVTAGGTLYVHKAVNAGTGDVTLTAPNIQLGAAAGAGTSITGGFIKLRAGQATTGAISTLISGTTASAVSGSEVVLEADNLSFAGLQPSFTGTSGIVYRTVSDNRAISTSSLTLSGATYTTPWLIIGNDETADSDTAGAITVDDSISRGANGLVLLSGAGVSQNAGKTITAGTLGVKAGGAVSLSESNSVSTLAAYSGSGDITFNNAGALAMGIVNMTVPGESSALNLPGAVAPGGSVTVTAAGNLTLNQYISALNTVTLNATGAGAIIDGNGSSTNVYASGLVANAVNGVGHGDAIETEISYLEANNTGANNIQVGNTGALQILSGMSNTGGNIAVSTTGYLTTGNTVISASGNLSLTAGGTLTIGSGGVSAGGSIALTGETVVGNVPSGGNVSIQTTGSSEPPPPTVVDCEANPDLTGCAAVLPSLATCTADPTAAGCTAVLPSVDTCTASPSTAGCTAVLPSVDVCTASPSTAGCTAVLPTLASCTTTPTLAGCTAVLPSVDTCTVSPSAAGCTAVLPSVDSCTTTPTLAGCTAVLPSLDACTSAPTTAGCTAVLPSVASCTTTPTLAGCTAVLPSLDACTSAPTTAGCTAVLPSLASCTSAPTTAGCTAVLPSAASCTTTPTLAGCTAVLPSLAACTTAPTTAGCSAVLPPLASCTANPALAGCTAVLPSLASCTSAPTTAGCTAVLPTLASCVTNPSQSGCTAVLPSVSQCVTNPAATGCTTVLPTLTVCTSAPATPGCSVVLPSLDQCVTNPAATGCTAVLPALADCTANPALAGCSVVLPPVVEQPAVTTVVSTLETVTPQARQTTEESRTVAAAPAVPPPPVAAATVVSVVPSGHTTGGTAGQFGGSEQPAASTSARSTTPAAAQPAARAAAATTTPSANDKKEEEDKEDKKKTSDSAGTKKDEKATAAKKPAQCN